MGPTELFKKLVNGKDFSPSQAEKKDLPSQLPAVGDIPKNYFLRIKKGKFDSYQKM